MNALRAAFRALPRGTVLWTAAAAVLVHAALRQFVDEGGLPTAALMGFLLGSLPTLPAAWHRDGKGLLAALCRGGLPVAAASVVAVLVLDPIAGGKDGRTWVHAAAFAALGLVALRAGGSARRIGVLVGVEWLKLRRGKLLKGGLLVAVLATLLVGLSQDPLEGESGWAVGARSLGAGFWAAEILLLVLGATAVAGEIGQGTMKMILPHAYRRSEWIAAKAAVLVLAAALFTICVVLTGMVHAWLTQGLDDVVKLVPVGFGEEDETRVFKEAAVMGGYVRDTVFAAGAGLVASAWLGLLLSCLFDSLVPALSASFLVFVGLKIGDLLLGFSRAVLDGIYAQYPDALRKLTVRLGSGFNERWDAGLLPDGLHLALLTSVLGLLVAVRLFSRRDLHS